MYERLTTKDIIAINQLFDAGRVVNAGTLDFAIERANQERSWLKGLALVVRAILIDHVFEEGNKRTAAALIAATFEEQGVLFDRDKIARGVALMLKRNTSDIMGIERVIKDAIRE